MILQTGDEFVVWTRLPGASTDAPSYRAARVLVGPPGAEPLRLGVGGYPEPEYRPFPEPLLWVLPPAEAQALLDGARAGGTADDDAP